MPPPRVHGVVKFGQWRPSDPDAWPRVLASIARWTVDGKALLYNDEHVPVDLGTLSGGGIVTLDATLEVYDRELWQLWQRSRA